jgi:hypothetical protein
MKGGKVNMRKTILIVITLCVAVSLIPGTALAAESSRSGADTDSAGSSSELLPVDVIQYPDRLEIRKIYELSPGVDPGRLPRDEFERGDYAYACSDILREVVIGEESKTVTVTETAESKKNDMDTILGLFPQYREYSSDEDDFAGALLLNTATIKSEISGYGNSSTPYTVSRNYPNLLDADTQHIPKSIEDNGKTLLLQDVQWRTDNTYNADDYEIGDRYTAIVTYGGTRTSSYVKGYTITADYSGEVYRKGVTVIRYTVIFVGTENLASARETTTVPETEPQSKPDASARGQGAGWISILISTLALLGSGAGVIYIALKTRKEKSHETISGYDYPDPYVDGDGGDPDSGGGEF